MFLFLIATHRVAFAFVRKIKFTTSLPRTTTYPGFPMSDKFFRTKRARMLLPKKQLAIMIFSLFLTIQRLFRIVSFCCRSFIDTDWKLFITPLAWFILWYVFPHCPHNLFEATRFTHVSKPAWTLFFYSFCPVKYRARVALYYVPWKSTRKNFGSMLCGARRPSVGCDVWIGIALRKRPQYPLVHCNILTKMILIVTVELIGLIREHHIHSFD